MAAAEPGESVGSVQLRAVVAQLNAALDEVAEAVKVVLQYARMGLKSSDIRMVKLVFYTDKEGSRHGKA
jgi:hypothetical protein